MLGFGRAPVPRRATLQTSNQVVIQIAHVQVPSHLELHETIDINDFKCAGRGQPPGPIFGSGCASHYAIQPKRMDQSRKILLTITTT